MARQRTNPPKRREPPVQFRPGVELMQLVQAIAALHALDINEAYKRLAALAVSGMDVRYYALIDEMAAAMSGSSSFTRCCSHIHTSLQTAGRLQDEIPMDENTRTAFILSTIEEIRTSKLHSACSSFRSQDAEVARDTRTSEAQLEDPPRKGTRRVVRRVTQVEDQPPTEQLETESEPQGRTKVRPLEQ